MARPLWLALAIGFDIQDRGFHEIQCCSFFVDSWAECGGRRLTFGGSNQVGCLGGRHGARHGRDFPGFGLGCARCWPGVGAQRCAGARYRWCVVQRRGHRGVSHCRPQARASSGKRLAANARAAARLSGAPGSLCVSSRLSQRVAHPYRRFHRAAAALPWLFRGPLAGRWPAHELDGADAFLPEVGRRNFHPLPP